MRPEDEIREKMNDVSALPAIEQQYDAGYADGAYAVLMWVLGEFETFEVSLPEVKA